MDNSKVKIKICVGSSCFARGNRDIVGQIKDYIKEHGLEEKIHFSGGHCFGECAKGPIIMVNDKKYYQVDKAIINTILEELF